jgi:hypothetical protein
VFNLPALLVFAASIASGSRGSLAMLAAKEVNTIPS